MTDRNQGGDAIKKTYHKKATGNALTTVKSHSREDELKLYGSAFWYAINSSLLETLAPQLSYCTSLPIPPSPIMS